MELRKIGDTGLTVPSLCFGTSGLGDMPDTYGYSVGEQRARATLHAIFDGPVGFLDTARAYGHGRSEERIGAVIRERGGLPEGFVLSTKLDRDLETGRFDAGQARRSLEQSLTALGLDRIPMLHLHDPEHARDVDEITCEGGALDMLFAFKEEGLCQAVGLAMGSIDMMFAMLRSRPFDVVLSHNRFTLLNRSADQLFTYAQDNGIAVLNAAPYASGVLAKGADSMPLITYQPADEAALIPVRRIEAVCAKHGVSMGAAALQFSMRDPRVTSTLVGVTKPERVLQTLAWSREEIPPAAWQELGVLPYGYADPEASRQYMPG